jgi:hypothetical protein
MKPDPQAISVGTLGNSKIDIDASESHDWCTGLYFSPREESDNLVSDGGIKVKDIDFRNYQALLVWHQALPEPLLTLVKLAVKSNPSILIIGNSHGYNKSIPELYQYYKLKVPQLHMDYYSMWGPYFTQRYREVFGVDARKRRILSLGSLRHDYLYRNFKWDKNRTNGRVLVIHEPVSAEGWNDPSPQPIGDNRVSDSIIAVLERENIPFDFKVHPNWPDFKSHNGKKMWSPPRGVRVVNISITDMLRYEAVVASWSSIQFEALSMGIPVINIKYTYPAVNQSEWGPGKYGLLAPVECGRIPDILNQRKTLNRPADMELLKFFLGDLGWVHQTYYRFIREKSRGLFRFNRFAGRLARKRVHQFSGLLKLVKTRLKNI